jgi:hypothetical protein
MIINVASIRVERDLIEDIATLNNMYPGCLTSNAPGVSYVYINIPYILKHELTHGFRGTQWKHQRNIPYDPKNNDNVVMFFERLALITALSRELPFQANPKKQRYIEENEAEENAKVDLKKPRL